MSERSAPTTAYEAEMGAMCDAFAAACRERGYTACIALHRYDPLAEESHACVETVGDPYAMRAVLFDALERMECP